MQEDIRVTRFREYLQIRSVQPNPDYASCGRVFKQTADELGLEFKEISYVPGKPIFILTWPGADLNLPSLVLNSHMDVVPVYPEKWKHEPFAADKRSNGDIIARGAQDCKCISMQYLEAVRALKSKNIVLQRTVHITFVPDEEIGGKDGMQLFVLDKAFRDLNPGLVLDEGLANPGDDYTVFYGERAPWWVRVRAIGNTGHGSQFIENTAAEKLMRTVNRFLEFREAQKELLHSEHCQGKRLGDVTTVNLTMLKGGLQLNIVPESLEACFDIRIAPTVDLKEFEQKIKEWTSEPGVSYEFIQKFENNQSTDVSENSIWWRAFSETMKRLKIGVQKEIFPAATDSRFIRQLGIPALGFSPMRRTEIKLHDHNEYLNEDVYLEGCETYVALIPELANCPAH